MSGRSALRRGVVVAAVVTMLGALLLIWPQTAVQADPPPDLFVGVRVRPTGEQVISRFSSMLVARTAERTITGLQSGDLIAGIDASTSATSEVYAIAGGAGSQRLYRIDVNTGAATVVGAFTESLDAMAGFDYNPVTNQLRVVLTNGKNFRLNPATGAVIDANATVDGIQPDSPLFYVAGDANVGKPIQVAAIANSNNVGSAASTVTYGWDRAQGVLVRIGDESPSSSNTGQAHTVVAGPADWKAVITSFEIAPSGRAYVFAPEPNGVDGKLGRVDLTTGNITPVVTDGTVLPNYVGITTLQNRPTDAAADFVGLTANNELVPFSAPGFNPTGPTVPITGTAAGDPILSIDFRGTDRKLYGLTGQGRLFTINTVTGATTLIGQHGQGTFAAVGFDWNGVTDTFRVIAPGTPTLNFRIDPATGSVVDADPSSAGTQRDQPLTFAAGDPNQGVANPAVLDIAYTNGAASAGPAPTTIWGIDATTGNLVRLGGQAGTSPNPESGQLFTGQPLGQQPAAGGIDVAPNGFGYAALTAPTGTVFLQFGKLSDPISTASPVVTAVGSMPIRLIGLAAVRADSPPSTTSTTFATTTTSLPASTTSSVPESTTTTAPGPTTTTTALPAGQGDPVTRVAGTDRIDTAVALSNAGFGPKAAGAVVLARADIFPDALTGTPLAVAKNAPILLTNSDSLHPAVETEIKRVLPAGGKVFLLGGDKALAPSVATKLQQLGFSVTRYSGDDRYGTALSVAINGLNSPATVLLATGLDFPDALSAGPAAAKASAAILLTAGDAMPLATKSYFDNHPATKRYAIGLKAAGADTTATPVFGVDRYDTSRKVAEQFFAAPYPMVGVASGTVFPDGLSGGGDIGRHGGALVLAAPTFLPTVISDYLVSRRSSIASGVAYGGPAALSQAVLDSVRTAIS